MRTVVGIFDSQEDAERAFAKLQEVGFSNERLTLLSPGTGDVESVKTPEREGSRMRKALGGVVGGMMGGTGGGVMGAAVASFFAPGVGPVLAMGFVAAAVAAVGGAMVGVEVGDELDRIMRAGLPKEELFFYEDALRQGRTVVIGLAEDDEQLVSARSVLAGEGAEPLDVARAKWWVKLRKAETVEAPAAGAADETPYRQGLEAALEPGARGKSYDEALDYLKAHHPDLWEQEAFRQGFERGYAYYRRLTSRQ